MAPSCTYVKDNCRQILKLEVLTLDLASLLVFNRKEDDLFFEAVVALVEDLHLVFGNFVCLS